MTETDFCSEKAAVWKTGYRAYLKFDNFQIKLVQMVFEEVQN